MSETVENSTCDRADDLISFLYAEADEYEARDFKQHLQECSSCQSEYASFGGVRESIALWKTEALSATRVAMVPAEVRRRSAVAAVREFFALSPLWLKGAVSFAAVVFCLMVILLVNRTAPAPPRIATDNGASYTQQQMNEAIAKALADQANKLASTTASNTQRDVKRSPEPVKNRQAAPTNRAAQWASSRPLSKAERAQLASDLRLLSAHDEDSLSLLSDRINQEF
jgi:hypothetical protein